MNFIDGELDSGGAPAFRTGEVAVPLSRYSFDSAQATAAAPVVLGVRPEHIFPGDAGAGQPFSHEVEIEIVEPMGADTLVWTKLGKQQLLASGSTPPRRCSVGERIPIGFDPARASLFDGASGERL